jgi:hypothetical protein
MKQGWLISAKHVEVEEEHILRICLMLPLTLLQRKKYVRER